MNGVKAFLRFRDWPLRLKMAALLLVASVLPLAVVSLIEYASERELILKAANALAGQGSFAVMFDRFGVRIAHSYNEDIVFHPGGKLDAATVNAFVTEQRFGQKTPELLAENLNESAQAAQQILVTAQQQVAGMDQVALAMQNIQQTSTQNMASTRQVERAAQDLKDLAGRLATLLAASGDGQPPAPSHKTRNGTVTAKRQ